MLPISPSQSATAHPRPLRRHSPDPTSSLPGTPYYSGTTRTCRPNTSTALYSDTQSGPSFILLHHVTLYVITLRSLGPCTLPITFEYLYHSVILSHTSLEPFTHTNLLHHFLRISKHCATLHSTRASFAGARSCPARHDHHSPNLTPQSSTQL